MTRTIPVRLAGIVALALLCTTAGVLHAAGPTLDRSGPPATATTQDEPLSTEVTPPADDARSGVDDVPPDVGTVLAGRKSTVEATYEQHLLEAKLENAPTEADQRSVIKEQSSRIGQRMDTLREYQRTAYQSYYRGDIDAQTLILRLTYVSIAASGHETAITALDDRSDQVSGISIDSEVLAYTGDVATMQGAVRTDIETAMTSGRTVENVHVFAGENTTVLARFDDETFVREAYRSGPRDRGLNVVVDASYIEDAKEKYPWLETVDTGRQTVGKNGDMVLVEFKNPGIPLRLLLDPPDSSVVREDQRVRTIELPTAEPVTKTRAGLTLQVNRTYPTGPAKATLVDSESGEPISGEIIVNNRTVGTTDADGQHWFVEPLQEPTVTAKVGVSSVSVTLDRDGGVTFGNQQSSPIDDRSGTSSGSTAAHMRVAPS